MNEKNTGNAKDIDGRMDVPPPTIVGPRPEEGQQGKITVPRGLERLLILAGMNEDWKRKALADPMQAADEAKIELSPSETAILKTIPKQTLGQMILSFARNRLSIVRDAALATGAAAAALLAATDVDAQAASRGIRPDIPEPEDGLIIPVPNVIRWETSLDKALAQAAISNKAVMVVCPDGSKATSRRVGPPGTLGITIDIPHSPFLKKLCAEGNAAVANAVATAGVIAVKPPEDEDHDTYVARLKKYKVSEDAPLVFFLAPDGSVLSKLAQPAQEENIVKAIQATPPLLADWMTKNRPPVPPAPPATKGLGLR